MLTRLPLLIVPAALVSAAAIALAAPKPAPPQKPKAVPLMPSLQPYYPKPGGVQSMMPNMTQMPNSRIIIAFDVSVSGHHFVVDTSGKLFEQPGPTALRGVTQLQSRPTPNVPKAIAPKPKH